MARLSSKVSSYEESRKQRMEENRKRMEALNLPQLAQALQTPPKPSPMKRTPKPKTERQMVEVRRSSRVANLPKPVYKDMDIVEPRRYSGSTKHKDLVNQVNASYEAIQEALEKAERLKSELGSQYPIIVKSMVKSHVSGCYWMGLQVKFCEKYLPDEGELFITLIDEDNEDFKVKYLARDTGLSGGWKAFAEAHDLVIGDAVVYQLTKPAEMKVYIIRVERNS